MSIDLAANREEVIALLRSTEREGIEYVIEDLDSWGFFKAPAAAVHHLNVEGGLAQHSLNVYRSAKAVFDSMLQFEPTLSNEIKPENLILSTLLHDVCKSDIYYKTTRKRKNELGQWEAVEGYKASYKHFPCGHGEKSVIMLLSSGLALEDSEIMAIRWHMGPWGLNMLNNEEKNNYEAAKRLFPLVTLVQTGDNLAAAIMERTGAEIDDL